MKNTKHTENLDNSTPQEITSQSKRKILTSIGVSSGILGASALSQQWTKPIVNSIILPAHAQTTDAMMTTMAPGMTTADPMDDMDMTTMAPTDPPAPVAGIVLSPMALGVVNLSGNETSRTRRIGVRLATQPTGVVSVTGGAVALEFTTTNWSQDQAVTVVIPEVTPDSMAAEKEAKVEFEAAGGGYDDVKADLTYTGGYYNTSPVSNVKVMVTDRTAPGMATVTWDKPDTRAMVEEYKVVSSDTGAEIVVTGTMATASKLSVGTPDFTVSVLYEDENTFVPATAVDVNEAIVG